ncbi:MAG: UvrD-helicase domain-containing protein [Bradymonadales bacterium]
MQKSKSEIWEQIATSQSHAVIEASAGTGKTFTVAKLVVELVARRVCALDEILIVTFTRAATAELQDRVLRFLRAAEAQAEGEERRALRAAIDGAHRASIYTIDSFTQKVLRANADLTRFPSRYELCTDDRLHQEAFARFLRKHVLDENFRKILAAFNDLTYKSKDYTEIRKLLMQWSGFKGELYPKAHDDAEVVQLWEGMRRFSKRFDVEEFGDVLAQFFIDAFLVTSKRKDVAACAKKIHHALQTPHVDWKGATKDFYKILDEEKKKRKGKDILGEPSALQQELLDIFKQLSTKPQPLSYLIKLSVYLPSYVQIYRALKEELSVYEHDDFLRMLDERIGEEADDALAMRIRAQYKLAIVDEFQDTNPEQWSVFRKIFMPAHGEQRLIVVGDPKQAIYGFRGGDVQTYVQARREIVYGSGKPYYLSKNFRSTPNLIRFMNKLYLEDRERADLLTSDGIKYDLIESAFPELVYKNEKDEVIEDFEAVKVMLIEANEQMLQGAREKKFGIEDARELLRKSIVQQIQILQSENLSCVDGEGKKTRIADDIVILCPRNKDVADMGKALLAASIAYKVDGIEDLFCVENPVFLSSRRFLPSVEAQEFHALLCAVERPHDLNLRRAVWNTRFYSIAMQDLFSPELLHNDALNDFFGRWQQLAQKGQYGLMFHDILEKTVFSKERIVGMPSQVLLRYQSIASRLASVAQESRFTIGELILKLEAFTRKEELPERFNQLPKEIADANVRLMSIHKAKGLEAQCVFLYAIQRAANTPPYPRRFHILGEDGETYKLCHLLESDKVYDEYCDKEEKEEAERLAYVALTRAAALLYLPRYLGNQAAIAPHVDSLDVNLLACDEVEFIEEPWIDKRIRTGQLRDADDVYRTDDASDIWDKQKSLLYPEIEKLDLESKRVVLSSYSAIARQISSRRCPRRNRNLLENEFSAISGGAKTGNYLHALLESLPFSYVAKAVQEGLGEEDYLTKEACSPDLVKDQFFVTNRLHKIQNQYGFSDENHELAKRMIYRILTRAIPVIAEQGLCFCNNLRKELDFTFPIPERYSVELNFDERFRSEKGFIIGYIDLLFFANDKFYILDWKSDSLDDVQRADKKAYVYSRYEWQIIVYSLALCKILKITNKTEFDAKFGGVIYAFLREVGGNSEQEPFVMMDTSYEDIQGYEKKLKTHDFSGDS